MRRFYIKNIPAVSGEMEIEGQQAKHLKSVLRMKTGSEIILLDGSGHEYTGLIKEFSGQNAIIKIINKSDKYIEPATYISIAIGFLKENKIDDLIRPLTELGVNEILPFISERSVSRPSQDKIDKKIERWNKISSESIKQCNRATKPEISSFNNLFDLIEYSAHYSKKIIFYEKNSESFLVSDYINSGCVKPESVMIIIGPEGGFSEKEIILALKNEFESYSLGNGILRAETAVICAASIVQYLYLGPDKKKILK